MKNLSESIRYVLWTAVLLLMAMGYGCKKDNIEPDPEPDPVNVPTTVGVRLQVDSIVCLSDWDNTGATNEIELYGFIRAFATYGYSVATPPAHYEKKDTALLWYRDANQYVVFNTGNVIRLNTLEQGYVDFYCDINKKNLCTIHLFPFLMDWDDNSWNPNLDVDLYTVRTDLLDNKTSWTMEELLTRNSGRVSLFVDYENSFPPIYYFGEIVIYYSVYPLNPESDVIYPAGRGPGMEFKEAEHVVPDPPPSQRVESPPTAFSNRLVVGQVPVSNFGPAPMSMYENGVKYSVYNYRPAFLLGGGIVNPKFEIRNLDDTGILGDEEWVGLVKNEALRDIYLEKPYREAIGTRFGDRTLDDTPYLQMVKYWRLNDSKQLAKGQTLKVGKETTKGISSTYGHEFSITTGIGGAGIFDIFSFNVEITNKFSSSYTYSLEDKLTTEETFGPYDFGVRVNVWQEVHEFRIVDRNGRLFTDPNYEFRSMVVATIPTDNIYTVVQEFK